MDYKYTVDGKKVVVIGKLNSSEMIVQEVFISNGSEIPAGEHFVVKSLLDSPSESWKSYHQKEKERLDKELEKTNDSFKNRIMSINREYDKISKVMRNKIKYMKEVDKRLSHKSFDLLFDFLSGKIKYLVRSGYRGYQIDGFNSTVSGDSSCDSDYLRMISLYGRSDGDLEYRLNTYSDRSGSDERIYPFKTYEECVEFISKKLSEKTEYGDYDIDVMIRYNIQPDPVKLSRFNKYKTDQIKKRLEEAHGNVNEITEELTNYGKKQLAFSAKI